MSKVCQHIVTQQMSLSIFVWSSLSCAIRRLNWQVILVMYRACAHCAIHIARCLKRQPIQGLIITIC